MIPIREQPGCARRIVPSGWWRRIFALLFASSILSDAAATSARLVPSAESGWPQFRGLRRDGISEERGLLLEWPEAGPRALWSVTNLGRGFSSPVISGGRLVITGDFDEHLALLAFDLTGGLLWRATNGAPWRTPYPGARASATFSGGRLYHENAHGRVACFEPANGREVWTVDVLKEFGGSNITWGVLCEDGWMMLLEATNDEFAVRGKFKLADARSRDAWAHPVILEGRLYLRYHDTLTCYDVR